MFPFIDRFVHKIWLDFYS